MAPDPARSRGINGRPAEKGCGRGGAAARGKENPAAAASVLGAGGWAGPFEKKGGNIFRPRSFRDNKSIQRKRWREQACARAVVRYRHPSRFW